MLTGEYSITPTLVLRSMQQLEALPDKAAKLAHYNTATKEIHFQIYEGEGRGGATGRGPCFNLRCCCTKPEHFSEGSYVRGEVVRAPNEL